MATGWPWACSKVNLHLAAAREDEGVGKWRSQNGLIRVLLREQALHALLTQWLLLMFAAALLSSGVPLPPHGDPKELRMGCSSGDTVEHKYLLRT